MAELEDEDERDDSPAEELDEATVLKTARRRFKLAIDYWDKQRQREKDDLKFQVPELQWSDEARRQRQGGLEGTMVIPARPMLSISKIDQPIQLILNQERQAKLGVEIAPLSPDADDEVAEIQQGIYRQIERDSNAPVARTWGFERAVKAGTGYYRVKTTWDEASDDPFDQVVKIERILYQDAIYFDPSCEQPDFSDAEWCFIARWLSMDKFKALYPESKLAEEMGEESLLGLDAMMKEAPEWVQIDDTGDRAVLVAEYFYKQRSKEIVKSPDGREREKEVTTVKQCLCVADEVLETGTWPGKYIPIIPCIGRELQPFDKERRWVGVIGPNKDSQRGYNYAVSAAMEVAALEPKAPFQATKEQIEGLEAFYQQANTRNFPVLPYNTVTVGGTVLGPPQRLQSDSSKLQLSMGLASQMNQDLQAGTFEFDPGLGQRSNRTESGVAIQRLQQQGDTANANYLHNLADISMNYEARVVLDVLPKIYDRPGRVVRVLGTEDDTEAVMLNAPFVIDPRSKMPKRIPIDPVTGEYPPVVPGPNGEELEVKYYDLSKGQYRVSVSIGHSSESQMQQAADEIGSIWESNPQMAPLIAPIYFKYRNFPGAKEMADILRIARDKQFPEMAQAEGDIPSKETLMAQLQQLQMQNQQMQQQLQQAGQAIQTDQAKQQANVQKAQIDADVKVQIAQLQAQVELLIAKAKIEGEGAKESLKAEENQKQRRHEMVMEAEKAALNPKPSPLVPYNPNYRGSLKKGLPSEEGI